MDSRPVKIYSSEDVPRLRYIAGIILGDILGLAWEVTTDKRKLGKHPVINYSTDNINGSFKISPDSLLFEKGVDPREIITSEWKSLPVFFPASSDSDIPFDIFAASFFLVTRYEEYLEFQPDKYGRYPASSSLAFKNGFLSIPVIDLWAREMSKTILKKYPTLVFKRNVYKALITVDSDEPFAFPDKGFIRSISGLFRNLRNSSGNADDSYRVAARGDKDPYEVYDYITDNIEKSKADSLFFFPVGDHSRYDKNPSWKNEQYRKLIFRIADKFKTGLHPSFGASENSSLIKTEVARLKRILNKEILLSRFHYLRLFMPRSYRDISMAGIKEDYSMGYPDEPGFRASIARPYYFYDLPEEKQTTLKIIPFQMMGATLFSNKNIDPAVSKEVILKLINETRKSGGLFVSVWHNTSLLENTECRGWREVFEYMLKTQTP